MIFKSQLNFFKQTSECSLLRKPVSYECTIVSMKFKYAFVQKSCVAGHVGLESSLTITSL